MTRQPDKIRCHRTHRATKDIGSFDRNPQDQIKSMTPHSLNGLLCTIMMFLHLVVQRTRESPAAEELIEILFQNYKSMVRPVETPDQTLEVAIGVDLQQIIQVDEVHESIWTNTWWQIQWVDYRLQWDPSSYGGITTIVVPPEGLWKPDIVLYNRVDFQEDVQESNVIVSHDGTCLWSPYGVFVTECTIDVKWFPFDTQTCRLLFQSWSYDITKMNLTLLYENVTTSDYIENTQWKLTGAPGYRKEIKYVTGGTFVTIVFDLNLDRKPLYYGFNLITPCAFISFLSVAVFCIPPDAGERIGFSVTILVSLGVYQLIIIDKIPANGEQLSILGIYFVSMMIMCICVTAVSIIILNLHQRAPPLYRVPEWVQIWICGRLAAVLRLKMNPLLPIQCKLVSFMNFAPCDFENNFNPDGPLQPTSVGALHGNCKHVINRISDRRKSVDAEIKELKKLEKIEINNWKFAAFVLDRLFLYLFLIFYAMLTVLLMAMSYIL